jgi:AraC-like DNA-binding protein
MLLAANLLSRSSAPLSRIAQDVGYQTDTAFSRAFRREYGAPPATWRRQQSHARDHSACEPPNSNVQPSVSTM